MNGLDLFSGIGGLTIALADWVKPIAYCENDRYAQCVLLSRMADDLLPIAPIWDDVRTLSGSNIGQSKVDIIYGGFPCQDISFAGDGSGLAGERSKLFYEVIRLTRDLQPDFVFLENVAAIVVRGLGDVLAAFTECGYDCRWTVNRASELGAPHHRARWWLLAHSNGKRSACVEKARESQDALRNNNDAVQENVWGKTADSFLGIPDGIYPRAHRVKSLGNAVVPQQAKKAFQDLMFGETR